MGPWIMMLASALADQKKKEEARKMEIIKLQMDQAARLGANTVGGEAAMFKHGQANQGVDYGAALQMLGHDDRTKKKSDPTQMFGDKPDADKDLLNPFDGKGDSNPYSFVPEDDQYRKNWGY